MPAREIIRVLNARMDALIGADRLKPSMRSQLLFEQVQAIVQMTPVTSAGALVISLLLMAVSRGHPVFPSIVVWSAALYAALFVAMRGWLRTRRKAQSEPPRRKRVRSAFLNAAFMGTIWGLLPMLTLPGGDPLLTVTTGIVMAGVLCASGFALLILPQAALAFSVPLLAGSFVAIVGLDDPTEGFALVTLLLLYALVMAFVCVRYARNLVHHLVSESKIREQKDIISLLLKEFEENSSDWLWELDRNGCFQRVSDRFSAASDVAKEQLVGLRFPRFPALDQPGERTDPRRAPARHRAARDLQRRRAAGLGRRHRAPSGG